MIRWAIADATFQRRRDIEAASISSLFLERGFIAAQPMTSAPISVYCSCCLRRPPRATPTRRRKVTTPPLALSPLIPARRAWRLFCAALAVRHRLGRPRWFVYYYLFVISMPFTHASPTPAASTRGSFSFSTGRDVLSREFPLPSP